MKELVAEIAGRYAAARRRPLKGHELGRLLRHDLPEALAELVSARDYAVDGSPGKGNWAETPWAAIFDRRITDTARKGIYVVYLFRSDGASVCLSLNQGTTEVREKHGRRYRAVLAERARYYGDRLREMNNFSVGPST